MISKKNKILLVTLAIGFMAVVGFAFPHSSFAATKTTTPIKVMGMAKFVLKGTVGTVSGSSITLHVTNTSKNAKSFDGKDQKITVGAKTTVTKNGKGVSLMQIKAGDKVKVFGIFNKKTNAIVLVRWIKVVPQ